jgi:Spy/CpxP family protein refolding chaperone
MNKTTFAATAAVLAAVWTVPGEAEARWGKGRGLERMAEKLGVDAATKTQIKQLVTQSRAEAKALRQQLRQEKRKLRELLKQDAPAEAAVLAQADALGRLKLKLKKLRLKTILRVRQLLTPQQRKALQQLREQKRRKLRAACAADVQRLCSGVEGKRGRKRRCLARHFDQLSPGCRAVVLKGLRHRKGRL